MPSRNVAILVGTVAVAALLGGCASRPQVTSQQESTTYLSRARGNYQPPGPASDPWGPYIREASSRYDVPEKWIREVMRQESGGHVYGRSGELITSGAGAMGLMQVMPATYDDLRSRYRELGDDPYDPHNNIMAGAAYIREMYDIFGAPGFLAAYNAGPGRLDDYLTRNRALPTETRRYVASIGPRIAGYEPSRPSPGAQYAMNSMPLNIPAGPRYPQGGTQFASAEAVDAVAGPVVVAEAHPAAPYITLNRPTAAPSDPYIHLNPPSAEPAPVVVAEAAPARPFIHLNPPTPETAPVVADAAPTSPYITLRPQQAEPFAAPAPALPRRSMVAEARGRAYASADDDAIRAALGAARRAEADELPVPPMPPPSAGRRLASRMPVEVAEFPEPPRPPSQRSAAAAELVALGGHPHSFSLFGTANAATLRPPAGGLRGGDWAVQVGAFANQSQARSATESARDHARDVLGRAQPMVASVRQPSGTLYRARIGGLSREAAAEACQRLSHTRTACMVVSPEAQR